MYDLTLYIFESKKIKIKMKVKVFLHNFCLVFCRILLLHHYCYIFCLSLLIQILYCNCLDHFCSFVEYSL